MKSADLPLEVLRIGLLGDFRLTYAGEPVTGFDQPRLQSLLAYLVMNADAPHARQHLAFSIWPESSEEQALTNLRNVLHLLRNSLPQADCYVEITRKTLQWRMSAPYQLDVDDLVCTYNEAERAQKTGSVTELRAALERTVDLYRGDLLPSCYEDWILPERERLRQILADCLERLIALLEEARDFAAAIKFARALLHHDPLSEKSYRRLMHLQILEGDRTGALRTYHSCKAALERELGVAPSRQTQLLLQHTLQVEGTPASSGLRRTSRAEASPFIGRHLEWQKLLTSAHMMMSGHTQLALLTGEPGIGKTRLAEELARWAESQGAATAYARCYQSPGRTAYLPIVTWLRSNCFDHALQDLHATWLRELARLSPDLLGGNPEITPPQPLSENRQRQMLLEALTRLVAAVKQPLLLVLDNLQWCDPETIIWLHHLMNADLNTALLVVATLRVEDVAEGRVNVLISELRRTAQLQEIELGRLGRAETAELAQAIAGTELGASLTDLLYAESEGVPLFIVEAMRSLPDVTDKGAVTDDQTRIDTFRPADSKDTHWSLPQTIQATIEARLAPLSPVTLELAGLAATLGREFTVEVLQRASTRSLDEFIAALDELWQRRIIRELDADIYDFSHGKIRAVIYDSLSPPRRRLYHQYVAQALATVCDSGKTVSGLELATHYRLAGLAEQAVPHYLTAAEAACRAYAYSAALEIIDTGLFLVHTLPGTPQSVILEARLLALYSTALTVCKGYTTPELEMTYSRMHELGRQMGDQQLLYATLYGHTLLYLARSSLEQARTTSSALLQLSQQLQAPVLMGNAHTVHGILQYYLGEFSFARQHLVTGFELCKADLPNAQALFNSHDPAATSLTYQALVLWFLGYPDQAQNAANLAFAAASTGSNSHSLAISLAILLWLYQLLGDHQAVQELADSGVTLSQEQGYPVWLACCSIFQGWIRFKQGEHDGAFAQIKQSIAALKATGAQASLPYGLSLLADLYVENDRPKAALSTLVKALALAHRNAELCYEAELYRLRGEALLMLDPSKGSDAEASFRCSIAIARSQEARSLELRSATSLARFWYSNGEHARAQILLREIYDWFTEGFSTPDLLTARSLLNQLA